MWPSDAASACRWRGGKTPGEATGGAAKQLHATGRVRGADPTALRRCEDPGRTKVAKEASAAVGVERALRQGHIKGMVDAADLLGGEHGGPAEDLGDPAGDGGRSGRAW
jgi:hypothetical protein